MKSLLVFCLLLLCSGLVMAEKEQKTYLCIAEVVGGLKFNETTNSWIGLVFKGGNKYLLKINDKEFPFFVATVTRFGSKTINFGCELDDNSATGEQVCNSDTGQFNYNLESLKFLTSYMVGYTSGDNSKATPSIGGGTCSPL